MFDEEYCSAACVRKHQKVSVRRSDWLLSCCFEKLEVEDVMSMFRKERLRESLAHTALQACIGFFIDETMALSIADSFAEYFFKCRGVQASEGVPPPANCASITQSR